MSRIRVISRDNGVGLSRDLALVADAFRKAGHQVEVMAYGGNRLLDRCAEIARWARRGPQRIVDLQVFLERVYPRMLPLASRNVLVPNPEWFPPAWTGFLPRFDAVACKTAHGADIFRRLGCNVVDAGFTSDDVFDPDVERVRQFFHLAGRSSAKGTRAVLEAWSRHPEWPTLVLVQNPRGVPGPSALPNVVHRLEYVDGAELRRLQNASLFHLCPSEMEGFGHYLNEGLSAGAIVLTTDGAPMNELVDAGHGVLIEPATRRRHGLVESQIVDAAGVEAAVAQALAMDDAELARRRAAARQCFLARDGRFQREFARLCIGAARLG